MKHEYSKRAFVSPYYMTLNINRKRQTLGYTTRPVDLTLNWGDKELRRIVKPELLITGDLILLVILFKNRITKWYHWKRQKR